MKNKLPLLTICASALILTAVLLPASALPDGPKIPGMDKLAHALMFFTLAVAMQLDFSLDGRKRLFTAFAFALPFAGLTEIIQLFADRRSTELLDFIADAIGFCLGLLFRRPCAAVAQRLWQAIAVKKAS